MSSTVVYSKLLKKFPRDKCLQFFINKKKMAVFNTISSLNIFLHKTSQSDICQGQLAVFC